MVDKVRRFVTLYTDFGAQINSHTYMQESEIRKELDDKEKENIELLGLSEDDSFIEVRVLRHRIVGSATGVVPGQRRVAPVQGVIQ